MFTNYKLRLELKLYANVQVVVYIVRNFGGVVEIYAPVGIDVALHMKHMFHVYNPVVECSAPDDRRLLY